MAALEKELVRALQALELQDLPDELIKAVFDTGGTTLRRAAATGRSDDAATLERLGDLDRVFHKYLKQHNATRANGSDDDEEESSAAQGSALWTFLTSEASNTQIMGDEAARAHLYAAYRALFAMLHTLINISEGYANLALDDKVDALTKALMASKVYLTWLQLPGGAAYGLFMPFVYRQVLDVVRKWVDVVSSSEAMSSIRRSGAGGSQRDKTTRKKGSRSKASHRSTQDEEDGHGIDAGAQKKLIKCGTDLMDTLAGFLDNFALSSSKESIIPTIEMVIHLQIVGSAADNSSASTAATRSQRLLEALINDIHGDVVHTSRVIVHCYIPGVSFQETAADARTATKFHKSAIEMVGLVQAKLSRTLSKEIDQEAVDDVAEQVSSLYLGIAQNLCLNAPDRAEERQKVLAFTFQTCLAPELQEADRVRFIQFLASYSKSQKAKNRQFAVELIGKIILEPTTWSITADITEELEQFVGIAPLLEILAHRSRDKVSTVRAKAIGAISSVLTAGLKGVHEGESLDGEGNEVVVAAADIIAVSLRNILYTSNEEELEETELMRHLVELFRESLQDEKTFVRKAAIQALEALLVVRPASINPTMRKDLFDIQARCTDTSLLVRVQAVKSLSSVLLTFPDDDDVQRLWNLGVLPLCVDPEASVQAVALDFVNRVIFDRLTRWYSVRNNDEERDALNSVWLLAAHLDGVMIRCLQKALRLLLKDSKVDVEKIIRASIHAIKTCLTQLEEDGETEPQYWGFSWIILDELAHSGRLVEAARKEQHNWAVVVECWNKLQEEELPAEFAEGSKRILRVIASLAPVIDAQDAKAIADSILVSLHNFTIPLHVISEAVLALDSICKAKAPSAEKGREISFAWGKQLLAACEVNLRACFEGEPTLVLEQTTLIQKQLISIGEVALLEFVKDEEKARESGVTLLSIATIKPLVQLFLPPQIVPNVVSQAQPDDPLTTPTKGSNSTSPVTIPIAIRVCAFVTLGKLCLRDQDLAKSCITMFIRELRTCDNQDIRSNILLILGDLCIRYTALVDAYVSTIALSFLDRSPLIRRNALLLFSQLILQDYIKWRESLLRFFLRAVVDQDDELSNLARHVLCGPLLLKAPHLFTNKFIEMIFVFNKFEGKVNFSEPFEREGIEELALPGSAQFAKRSQLYRFLLQNMSDEQKLQISMKLCTEVLEEVSEGKLKLCDNPSAITDFGTEAILKDTFAILCSPDIKLSSARDDQEGEDGDADAAANGGEGGGPSVASQLAAAKGKLLSKMSKKNFLENVVPVLIGLKHKLESKRSPLMRYLLHYIRELFKLYGQEVRDILSADPQMAMEVEYDLRQFELQQQKSQDNPSSRMSIGGGISITPTKNGGQGTGPRTPLQVLEGGRTPQLLSDDKVARGRRRQSMPTAGTPALPVRQRHVTSDEGKTLDNTTEREGTTMLFSPDKDTRREKWQVTAKSPVVASRKPGHRFSQQDLEDNMQRDLAAAFGSAASPPASPNSRTTRDKLATTLSFDNVEDDDEDEHVKLPLKKKTKKKKEKAVPKKKASEASDEEDKESDPFEVKTPKISRSKRKRN